MEKFIFIIMTILTVTALIGSYGLFRIIRIERECAKHTKEFNNRMIDINIRKQNQINK